MTEASTECLEQQLMKLTEIDLEIFWAPALENEAWKTPNRSDRHLMTRYSAHGIHR